MSDTPGGRRRLAPAKVLALITLAVGAWGLASATLAASPERTRLTVGLAAQSVNVLTLHVAALHTAAAEGLDLQLVSLGGGSRVTAAVVSDSVDLGVVALNTLLDGITAGHPIKAYYNLSGHAEFEWFGRAGIGRWADVRSAAVTSRGSLTEALTLHVLQRHSVRPEGGVQIVAAGEVASLLSALRAGRVDAAILVPPFTRQATALGLPRLGTEEQEVGSGWPRNLVVAREATVAQRAPAIRAFLRAYVRAARLIRADREIAIRAATDRLKYERADAEDAYRDLVRGQGERGDLPPHSLEAFWQVALTSGWVSETWPESRYLDRRLIDTFQEWAP
jgi:ABC-type nitrate/sulfonate/bicarbonate transport system substrate-binding protein